MSGTVSSWISGKRAMRVWWPSFRMAGAEGRLQAPEGHPMTKLLSPEATLGSHVSYKRTFLLSLKTLPSFGNQKPDRFRSILDSLPAFFELCSKGDFPSASLVLVLYSLCFNVVVVCQDYLRCMHNKCGFLGYALEAQTQGCIGAGTSGCSVSTLPEESARQPLIFPRTMRFLVTW